MISSDNIFFRKHHDLRIIGPHFRISHRILYYTHKILHILPINYLKISDCMTSFWHASRMTSFWHASCMTNLRGYRKPLRNTVPDLYSHSVKRLAFNVKIVLNIWDL